MFIADLFADNPHQIERPDAVMNAPVFSQTNDVFARFPKPARIKVDRLRRRIVELRAVGNHYTDQIMPIGEEITRREALLRQGQGGAAWRPPTSEAGWTPPPDELSEGEKRLVELRAEKTELLAARDAVTEKLTAEAGLMSRLDQWARALREPTAEFASPVSPKLRKGEALEDAITRLRETLNALHADLAVVRSAPLTAADAKSRAREQINALADTGAPDVSRTIAHGDPVTFPSTVPDLRLFHAGAGASVSGRTTDATALLAWLFRDQLADAIDKQIDAAGRDDHALPADERRDREAALVDAILQAERDEEALIVMTEKRGNGVVRRVDADPRAVLGLADDLPAMEDLT
ncbi:MAG: hypothetical protein ABJP10_16890 [Nitratireductor sp.]